MSASTSSRVPTGWKALLICSDRAVAEELKVLLAEHLPLVPIIEQTVYPSRSSTAALVAAHTPTLCFLDMTGSRDAAFGAMAEMLAADPSLAVIGLLAGNDPDLILTCLRQGAAEFLLRPFTDDQFLPVVERLITLKGGRSASSLAKTICVMPAKGACGGTTIACNLAFQWKRIGSKKILLADLDPLTGMISFLLKLKSSYSFLDALTRGGPMDVDLWKGLVVPYSGVDILLSPDSPVHGIDEMHTAKPIVEFARETYENVVIDAPGVYGKWSLELAHLCDEILLVTTNELPAVQSAQRCITYLERNRVERSKVRILVNRFRPDTGLSCQLIQTAFHTEVYHTLPADEDSVNKALVEGRPVPSGSAFGRQLAKLADKLAGKEDPSANGEVKEKKKPSSLANLFSLFSRSNA
jgi:pilus assembly protein CpaE